MNRTSLAIAARAAAGALLSASFGTALAATITVNPGESIQKAVNAAVAGDTVRVLPGTYVQKVLISGKTGTAGAFITLKGDSGAIISGSGLTPVGREGLITIKNSNFVRVEGFDVTGLMTKSANTPVGILVEGNGAHLQIVNNKVHDIRHTSTCTEPCAMGAHGLAVFGTNATGVTDLLVQGNEVYQNVLQASEALVLNGNVDRFEVLGNNVHDNNNIGFDFIGYEGECAKCGDNDRVRNGVVRGNTAKNNSSVKNPWYRGVGSAGGFYVDGGRFIVFDRNVSTGNDIGFEFASEHKGKATEDIVMSNNFVYKNIESGLSVGGYSSGAGQSRRINVHNNSFYRNMGWGTELVFNYKVTDSRFSNNIFYGKGKPAENYVVEGTGHSGNVWGVNMWFGQGTSRTGLPGTLVINDPRYVAPDNGNLRLQAASPALNNGAVGAALTTWTSPFWATQYPSGAIPVNGTMDFDGQARVEGIIDLGADEFGTAL
jgi:hypothetical protein